MKKFTICMLLLALALSTVLVGCGNGDDSSAVSTESKAEESKTESKAEESKAEESADASADASTDASADASTDASTDDVKVMTYAEYAAAEVDAAVVIEAYVQAKQSWWDNKATIYTQDKDGAYFIYEMSCSEEDFAKLVPGTKIRVTGFKTIWEGEVEIASGSTFEIIEGAHTYIAEPVDLTDVIATEDLINYQNQLAVFKGMTVEKVEFKNGEPGDDIYVTLGLNGASYSFCVERYLTDPETDVYKTVSTLEVGKVIDVEGFVYWYKGSNPHITKVTVVQ